MCGIYGWQVREGQHLTTFELTALTLTLAREMETRGRDSFGGALWLPNQSAPTTIRQLGKITEKGQELLMTSTEAPAALVHTRAATTGKVIEANCHPFQIGDVLGVHNGIISNHEELLVKYQRDLQVDSMNIFAHLNENRPLTDLEGYGAVVYTRASEEYRKFWFGRTSSGSFHVAKLYRETPNKDGDNNCAVIFASTYTAVYDAAKLMGLEARSVTLQDDRWFFIEDANVYHTEDKVGITSGYTSRSMNISNICPKGACRRMNNHAGPCGPALGSMCPATGCFNDRGHGGACGPRRYDKETNNTNWKTRQPTGGSCSNPIKYYCQRNPQCFFEPGHTGKCGRPDVTVKENKNTSKTSRRAEKWAKRQERKRLAEILEAASKEEDSPDNSIVSDGQSKGTWTPSLTEFNTAAPFPALVRSGHGLTKCSTYPGKDLPVVESFLCPDCGCKMQDHMWGMCASEDARCTAEPSDICKANNIPCCRECGCYLVETVHKVTAWNIVQCEYCQKNCCSNTDSDDADTEGDSPSPNERHQRNIRLLTGGDTTYSALERPETDNSAAADRSGVVGPFSDLVVDNLSADMDDQWSMLLEQARASNPIDN